MTRSRNFIAGMLTALVVGAAPANGADSGTGETHGADASAPRLDPLHISITLPEEIRWTGKDGEQKALLFGNPEQAGTYAMLIRWGPGHFSKPHFHSRDRMIYIVSGNWWMSSSERFEPEMTVPVEAGSFVIQKAGTVHWDGALREPCVLLLIGEGPVTTTWLEPQAH
jgi:quercetin dioxygenase-like cupin family protein